MKTLVVHIGTPKAGSTSLQGFLRNNRTRLGALGIEAPAEFDWRGIKDSALEATLAGRVTGDDVLQRFEEGLAAMAGDVAVVSAEGMAAIDPRREAPQRLAEIGRRAGFETVFLAVLRPQPDYLNSTYAQRARSLRMPLSFERFVARSQNDPRYDYGALIAQWRNVPGTRLVVLPFRPEPGRDLGETFLRGIGLDGRIDAMDGRGAPVPRNERPGPLTIEAYRRLSDPRIAVRLEAAANEARRVVAERLGGIEESGTRFCGFDAAGARRAADRHARGNDALARAFWGVTWEEALPFDPARWRRNVYDPATASAEAREAIAEVVEGILADYGGAVGWPEKLRATIAAWTGRPELAAIRPRQRAERGRAARRARARK